MGGGGGGGVFFFQAEDGIRGFGVTGVQTCALPIYSSDNDIRKRGCDRTPAYPLRRIGPKSRSEERRVGKSVDLGGRRIIKKKTKKRL